MRPENKLTTESQFEAVLDRAIADAPQLGDAKVVVFGEPEGPRGAR